MAPYSLIICDAPWKFGDKLPGKTRGAERLYPCMTVAELMRFPLPPIADNALMLFWRVASMQQEALDVVRAWGFVVKSEIVWNKLTVNGKQHFGMGRYVRASHEVALVCTRGRPLIKSRSIRSTFSAPVGAHSQKPEIFYSIAEALCDGPRLELFARRRRDGWDAVGNQIAP